jgi:Rha family phage regulatory protein
MSIVKQDGLSLSLTNGKVYCDSRELAKQFDKRHANVLRSIENEIDRFGNSKLSSQTLVHEYFKKSEYIDERGKTYPRYLLSFKGFQQIALQFSGDEAFLNRVKFIEFFEKLIHTVEKDKLQAITNSEDNLWLKFRDEGKVFRTKLTDTIKKYVTDFRYETEKKFNDGKYYYHYTTLIYDILNINLPKGANPRDVLDKRMLVRLEDLEDKVADMIVKYSEQDIYYKDVYKKIKDDFARIKTNIC